MAVSLSGIGDAELNAGDKARALAAYEEGVAIVRELVARRRQSGVAARSFISLNRVGDVKRDFGDTAGALASYDESLAIRRRLAETDPSNVQWRSDEAYVLAKDWRSEAHHRRQSGRTGRVRGRSGHCSRLCRGGHQPRVERELAVNLTKIGAVKREMGDAAGALAAL